MRAPSTLGTFLRLFIFGHVRQLDAVAARLLPALARAVPVLPRRREVVIIDMDDTVHQTYGYAKQGAGPGYTGVKGALRIEPGRERGWRHADGGRGELR